MHASAYSRRALCSVDGCRLLAFTGCMSERKEPIEPGPEPDTTEAGKPKDDDDSRIEAEDAPAMMDDTDDHVDDPVI